MKSGIIKTLPFLAILSVLLLLYYPLFIGKSFVANGMIYSDFWQFNFPLKEFYHQEIALGKIGLWTSYLGNGYPVFAEGQVGALYPLHILLFSLFPTAFAFNLDIFIHFFIAFIFTYAFARVSVGLSKKASFVSGMCYVLSGYFFVHVMFLNVLIVVSYLPVIFLLIERIWKERKIIHSAILSLVIVLIVLAGHLELAYYVIFSAGVFFLLMSLLAKTDEKSSGNAFSKSVFLIVVSGLFAVGISAIQLIPTYELYKSSNRNVSYDLNYVTSSRWPLKTLGMFVYPAMFDKYSQRIVHALDTDNFTASSVYGYMGIIPLILAFFAIFTKKGRYKVIFLILLILALLYGIGRSTSFFSIIWSIIPGMKSLRFPVKIMFLVEFCLAILAGIGFDHLTSHIKVKTIYKQLTAAILISLIFIDIYFNNARRFNRFLYLDEWLKIPASAEFLKEKLENGKYRYFATNTNNLYQKDLDIKAQKTYQNLLPVNFNLIYKLPSNREYFTLFNAQTERLNNFTAVPDFKENKLRYDDGFFRSLAIQSVKYLLSDYEINSDRLALIDKFPFSGDTKHKFYLKTDDLKTELADVSGVYVYEVKGSIPRANIINDYEIAATQDESLKMVFSENFDPASKVILEKKPETVIITDRADPDKNIGQKKGTENYAIVVSDRQDEIEIKAKSNTPAFLLLNDTYYPGWKAFVDGEEREIIRANYSFRAVQINPGTHTILMKYQPKSVKTGLVITTITAVVWIFMGAYLYLRSRFKANNIIKRNSK